MPIDDPWAPDRDPRSDVKWQNIIKPDDQTVRDFVNPKRDTGANAFGHMLSVPKREPSKALPYTLTPHEGDDPFTAHNEASDEEMKAEHPLVTLGRRFGDALNEPGARQRLHRLMETEVGGQGPRAAQAFAETVRNRWAARNHKSVWHTMNDAGYYPKVSLRGREPTDPEMFDRAIDAVTGGSNISNYATGNASGKVGFAGGPQTYNPFTGERFGIEGPDRAWADSVRNGQLPAGPDADFADYQSGDKTVRLKLANGGQGQSGRATSDWAPQFGPGDLLKLALGVPKPAAPEPLPDMPIAKGGLTVPDIFEKPA